MRAVTIAYDSLISTIEAALPNHVELINPYIPENNDDLTYEAAFGVAFGDGENTQRQTCTLTMRRLFTITLTRKIFKADLARNSYSVEERRSAEKQLFEDLGTLVRSVESNVTLNSTGDDAIGWCKYLTDSGLETIGQSADKIMLRAIFEIEYFEDLSNQGEN